MLHGLTLSDHCYCRWMTLPQGGRVQASDCIDELVLWPNTLQLHTLSQSSPLILVLDMNKTYAFSAGGFGTAADPFSRALCSSLAQLRAVYAEAEHAGISLGERHPHSRLQSLPGMFFSPPLAS